MKRIVVGVDGSDGSQRALRWAIDLARETEAEIVAVHVLPLAAVPVGGFVVPATPVLDDEWRDRMQTVFEMEWCAPLREAEVKFRTVLAEGAAAPEILRLAGAEDAWMIVVGDRGRGGFTELLLGSVTHQLTHHANRPVVVVRPRG